MMMFSLHFLPFWFIFVLGDSQCWRVSLPDAVNQESIEKSVEEVDRLVAEEGLNCLINNAGINVVADFHTVTAEKMIENFHTNSVAPLMITKVMSVIWFCSLKVSVYSLTLFVLSVTSAHFNSEIAKKRSQTLFFSVPRSWIHKWFISWMLQNKTKGWPWWKEVTKTP